MVKAKGTAAFGLKHQRTHGYCRRCGKNALHYQKHRCASCGFGANKKMRLFTGWGQKVRARRGQGTGRMRYMKDIPRLAKNGFRTGTTAKPKERKT